MATQRRQIGDTTVLFFGTHFPTCPAGHVVTDGDGFRFLPVPGA